MSTKNSENIKIIEPTLKTLDISKDGDLLEITFVNLIREYIPYYENIWSRFVGHDKKGKMLKSIGLTAAQEKKRKLFSQKNYTCLESIIGISLIVENSKTFPFTTYSMRDLILLNNDLISLYAHLGRIRDCLKSMGELFNINNLYDRFEKFWERRNAVLHGKKLPFAIIGGHYIITSKPEIINNSSEFVKEALWEEINFEDLDFLEDYLEETFKLLVYEVNACLASLFERLKIEFGEEFRLEMEQLPVVNTSISGTINFTSSSEITYHGASSATTEVEVILLNNKDTHFR